MKIGFAVQNIEGIESKVYSHFGSAPAFIIVDTESQDILTVNNKDLHHAHGACNPIMALDGKKVDAMIVGGIGAGAIVKLNALGIKVLQAGTAHGKRKSRSVKPKQASGTLHPHNACQVHQGGCGH